VFLPLLVENKYSFYSSGRLTDINHGEKIIRSPGQIYGEISFNSLVPRNHIDIGIICTKANFLEAGGFSFDYNCFQDWNLVLKLVSKYGNGIKIKKHSYVVNEDVNLKRITNQANRAIGYMKIINDFDGHLSYTQKLLLVYESNSLMKKFTFLDFLSIFASIISMNLMPIKGALKKFIND
jgi:hypothetical protein